MIRPGKKGTHKHHSIEGGLPGPSKLQGPVPEPNSASCNRPLAVVAYINKQGGTHSAEMCALLWKIMTWCHHYHITLKARHIPSTVKRMVTASTGVQTDLPKVVHRSCRPICHSSEPQTSTLSISCPRPKGLGHRCSEHKLDESHCLCLPSDGSPSQGDPKNQAMLLPDHRNSPRLARFALLLGPSAALNRDPTTTSSVNKSETVPQLCVPQQSTAYQPPRLVSSSGQLQEQGFSVEVAERIAAPQRSSTRIIYKSKWALFEKLSRENLVGFSSPSVKHISDFFMYLYQDLNRRPSTIEVQTFTGYSPVFTGIVQKVPWNLPKWNLTVVLNELTKVPFEPMKDTDLKHLTLKTAFLLALASGKRCSEIQAWVVNKVSNLGQWEKVALFPSDFIAKNQLAKEGSQSVSPVTIPALTTIVNGHNLDRTKDPRGSRSSWLKQTILLCYKQADQQA